MEMSSIEQLWPGGPVLRQAPHFRLGTDTVLLADFAARGRHRRGIDLGCASGSAMLLLLAHVPNLHMTGIELVPEAAALAAENMEINGLAARSRVLCGDLREHRTLLPAGCFDLVVANPPYYPAGSGKMSADPRRAAARGELTCTLADICEAAAWLCQTGGSICLVHKPERLSALFCALTAHGIEPKRLRLVSRRPESAPSLVLVEGRRGGKSGLVVEPPLLLQTEDGSESTELRRICRK